MTGLTATVVGAGVHVPGHDAVSLLTGAPSPAPACASGEVRELLGRKGLLYRDPATRFALCATQSALGLAAGSVVDPELDALTAVVASSNLGNVETVCSVAERSRRKGGHSVSPMEAPNASSNVIASTVASRFGLGGPNLLIATGPASGADAIRVGLRLLAAGRATGVVVVGAEPEDDMAQRVAEANGGGPLVGGAAAIMLVPIGDDVATGITLALETQDGAAEPSLRLSAEGEQPTASEVGGHAGGDLSGALGVVQVALGAWWLTQEGHGGASRVTSTCSDAGHTLQTTLEHWNGA